MGEGPAVRIEALVKRYGKITALDEVTLSVEQREALGLVGANGAGKSTLIRCLLDLTAGERGRIEIFGVPAPQPAARARLAYLPERFMPPHYLTGTEFLRTLAALGGERYDEARICALVAELELEREALARPVRAPSKGMTQKLGLAACLRLERDLYVLDEPMGRLGPGARRRACARVTPSRASSAPSLDAFATRRSKNSHGALSRALRPARAAFSHYTAYRFFLRRRRARRDARGARLCGDA